MFLSATIISLMLISCKNEGNTEQQSYTSGNENILVDESFAPIMEDVEYIFESTYSDASLRLIMKSENELLNLFLNDTAQVAVLSRLLTKDESRYFESRNIKIRVNRFAVDGIALITHKSSKD
mgnify:FL=1